MWDHYQFIDLSHTLHPEMPSWNGGCGFKLEERMNYEQGCLVHAIKMHGGIGTHMDAPIHFIPGAASVADIPLNQCIIPLVVMDVSSHATQDYLLTRDELLEFIKLHDIHLKGCFFALHTGWSKRFLHPEAYRNTDVNGKMHFPGLRVDAAQYLIEHEICGLGIDTLSPDGSHMDDFPVHRCVLGAGKYILENLNALDQVPTKSAFIIALPLKAHGAAECGVRALAALPV